MNLRKLIALITVAAFLYSSVIAPVVQAAIRAEPVSPMAIQAAGADFIPAAYGTVTAGASFDSSRVVIAIQDLHCHPEVQHNISNIIAALDKQFGVKKVFVEGGYGPVDTAWLNGLTDREIRRTVTESLMDTGRLTGTEYFALTHEKTNVLYGLEDEALHRGNIARLGRIIGRKPFLDTTIALMDQDAALLQVKYLSPRHRRLNKIIAAHRSGATASETYYSSLLNCVRTVNNNPDSFAGVYRIDSANFPSITAFLSAAKKSKKISYPAISRQLRSCVALLRQKLSFNDFLDLQTRTDNFTRTDRLFSVILPLCASRGIDLTALYPGLVRFAEYLDETHRINPVALITEDRRLVEELHIAFSRDTAERDVAFAVDFFAYFKDYLLTRLSADDLAYFTGRFDKFRSTWATYAYADRFTALQADISLLREYYAANLKRNDVFVNTIMDGQKAAVLPARQSSDISAAVRAVAGSRDVSVVVVGGFHTAGLENLLAQRGITYITVTPAVTQDTAAAAARYKVLAVRQGNDDAPFIAVESPASTLTPSQNALGLTVVSSERGAERYGDIMEAGWTRIVGQLKREPHLFNKQQGRFDLKALQDTLEALAREMKCDGTMAFSSTGEGIVVTDVRTAVPVELFRLSVGGELTLGAAYRPAVATGVSQIESVLQCSTENLFSVVNTMAESLRFSSPEMIVHFYAVMFWLAESGALTELTSGGLIHEIENDQKIIESITKYFKTNPEIAAELPESVQRAVEAIAINHDQLVREGTPFIRALTAVVGYMPQSTTAGHPAVVDSKNTSSLSNTSALTTEKTYERGRIFFAAHPRLARLVAPKVDFAKETDNNLTADAKRAIERWYAPFGSDLIEHIYGMIVGTQERSPVRIAGATAIIAASLGAGWLALNIAQTVMPIGIALLPMVAAFYISYVVTHLLYNIFFGTGTKGNAPLTAETDDRQFQMNRDDLIKIFGLAFVEKHQEALIEIGKRAGWDASKIFNAGFRALKGAIVVDGETDVQTSARIIVIGDGLIALAISAGVKDWTVLGDGLAALNEAIVVAGESAEQTSARLKIIGDGLVALATSADRMAENIFKYALPALKGAIVVGGETAEQTNARLKIIGDGFVSLGKSADRMAENVFQYGLPALNGLIVVPGETAEQTSARLKIIGNGLVALGKTHGWSYFVFFQGDLPAFIKEFGIEFVGKHWTGLVSLGTSAGKNSNVLLQKDLADFRKEFGDEFMEKHWTDLVALGTSAGEDIVYLLRYGLPALKAAFDAEFIEKHWTDLVALGTFAGGDAVYFFMDALPALKAAFDAEFIEKHWADLVVLGKSAGKDARYLFEYVLPALKGAIVVADNTPQQTSARLKIIGAAVVAMYKSHSAHVFNLSKYGLPALKESIVVSGETATQASNRLKRIDTLLGFLAPHVGEYIEDIIQYGLPALIGPTVATDEPVEQTSARIKSIGTAVAFLAQSAGREEMDIFKVGFPTLTEDNVSELYIRGWLYQQKYDVIKGEIERKEVSPVAVIKALLHNQQNNIVSGTADMVRAYGGKKPTVLEGLVSLASKIKIIFTLTPVMFKDIQNQLQACGVDISKESLLSVLRENGYGVYDGQIIAQVEYLLSAYRGSAEHDHVEANYLTHAVTTAIINYAAKGGEAKGRDAIREAQGYHAFHEFDLGLLSMVNFNNRKIDTNVSLAFYYRDAAALQLDPDTNIPAPLPEYSRKRTKIIGGKTVTDLLDELTHNQMRERVAKEKIYAQLLAIQNGTGANIDAAITEIKNNLGILDNNCGLKKEYYAAVFGHLDKEFFTALKVQYKAGSGSTRNELLAKLLTAAMIRQGQTLVASLKPGDIDSPRAADKKVVHPFIALNKTILDYLENEQTIRSGTFEEESPSAADAYRTSRGKVYNTAALTDENLKRYQARMVLLGWPRWLALAVGVAGEQFPLMGNWQAFADEQHTKLHARGREAIRTMHRMSWVTAIGAAVIGVAVPLAAGMAMAVVPALVLSALVWFAGNVAVHLRYDWNKVQGLPLGIFVAEDVSVLQGDKKIDTRYGYLSLVVTKTPAQFPGGAEIHNTGIRAGGKAVWTATENGVLIVYVTGENGDFARNAAQVVKILKGRAGVAGSARAQRVINDANGVAMNPARGAVVFDYTNSAELFWDAGSAVLKGDALPAGFEAITNVHNAERYAMRPEIAVETKWSNSYTGAGETPFNQSLMLSAEELQKAGKPHIEQLQKRGGRIYVSYAGTDAIEVARLVNTYGLNGAVCPNIDAVTVSGIKNKDAWVAGRGAAGNNGVRAYAEIDLRSGLPSLAGIRSGAVVRITVDEKSVSGISVLNKLPYGCVLIIEGAAFREATRLTGRDISDIELFGVNILAFLHLTPATPAENHHYERKTAFALSLDEFEQPANLADDVAAIKDGNIAAITGNAVFFEAVSLHLRTAIDRQSFLDAVAARYLLASQGKQNGLLSDGLEQELVAAMAKLSSSQLKMMDITIVPPLFDTEGTVDEVNARVIARINDESKPITAEGRIALIAMFAEGRFVAAAHATPLQTDTRLMRQILQAA
ncbi:MAG: hypothetical protein NTU66_07310 [Elusimicrobia bacterium]|nr:hypothetical protein [Elusimicrobiota bacterium]